MQLLVTVECEDPADAARTDAVARVLDDPHALTGVISVAPGTLLFTAFTGDDGLRGIMWARQEAMENLARLDGEDDRVWQLQLARQVVRPDFWRVTPSTIDEHKQWRSWRATV